MLLDRKGAKADIWTTKNHVLLPFDQLEQDGEALLAKGNTLGVIIPNSLKPDVLLPWLGKLSLIAIVFPSFSDGRGFSQAKALRRLGFGGILRASGPLIIDQFAYALNSGFDEVDLPEASAMRQPEALWLEALNAFSANYQRGYGDGVNILDARRAARQAKVA